VILASEDVGLADPHALPLAVAAHHAVDFVGLPEAELTLAHATLYIATAPKSNSATLALGEARRVLAEEPVQAVPAYLRDKGGQASKRMGQGKGYSTPMTFPEGISGQAYLEHPGDASTRPGSRRREGDRRAAGALAPTEGKALPPAS
jgi:putative ATPase